MPAPIDLFQLNSSADVAIVVLIAAMMTGLFCVHLLTNHPEKSDEEKRERTKKENRNYFLLQVAGGLILGTALFAVFLFLSPTDLFDTATPVTELTDLAKGTLISYLGAIFFAGIVAFCQWLIAERRNPTKWIEDEEVKEDAPREESLVEIDLDHDELRPDSSEQTKA